MFPPLFWGGHFKKQNPPKSAGIPFFEIHSFIFFDSQQVSWAKKKHNLEHIFVLYLTCKN
jgi:hypothetical protein